MTDSIFKIIKLLPDEWGKYKKIRLEAIQSDPIAFADTYETAALFDDSYWKNRLVDDGRIWLFAENDSQIVGMIGAYIKNPKQSVGTATLEGVYVSKSYRGKGISRKLMLQLLIEMRQTGFVKKVKLWVAETQISARKLYENTGFIYIGKAQEPIEYEDKLYDELIMERELL